VTIAYARETRGNITLSEKDVWVSRSTKSEMINTLLSFLFCSLLFLFVTEFCDVADQMESSAWVSY
jgi:hypothetical protein